jgi:hypothetical protein
LTAQHVSSDIIAHHQELLNCTYSFWFYTRLSLPAAVISGQQRQTCVKPKAVIAVQNFLMMSVNIARNMLSSQGTIE